MTAPDPLAETPKKLLPTGGRPYISPVRFVMNILVLVECTPVGLSKNSDSSPSGED